MSRQVGSLHRSISYPANLTNTIPIIPFFAFPPPESPHVNTSSGMNSDANSNIYYTIFQFKNSELETPDEFDNFANPAHLHFPNLPFNPSTPKPEINLPHLPQLPQPPLKIST